MQVKDKSRAVFSALAVLLIITALAGCAATDVVAKIAKTSFDAMLRASSERLGFDDARDSFSLESPGGDKAYAASDFSRNNEGGSIDMARPDFEFTFDAGPFIAAGLDPSALAGSGPAAYAVEDGRLVIRFEISAEAPAMADRAAAARDPAAGWNAALGEILRVERVRVGYHAELDHYGIKLGGGNMLEWAKDSAKNDKDLVFVLDPGPLKAAGVDTRAVEGWVFAGVKMMDAAGKPVTEDKLLKPFDLH